MHAVDVKPLSSSERTYYRDSLRRARYAALENAEAFHQICFALEGLGLRLNGCLVAIGAYRAPIRSFLQSNGALQSTEAAAHFDALYKIVQDARNDAMHTGVYARHVSAKAVELCLLLEDALMDGCEPIKCVREHMVKEPVCVEPCTLWLALGS